MPASVKHLTKPGSKFVTSLLAKWNEDGLYYTGEVIECDTYARRCLVRFEDNSDHWLKAEELHAQLNPKYIDTEQIVCCVCDQENSVEPNEIVLCDSCQQGYHVECHKPSINRESCKLGDDTTEWECSTCNEILKPKSQSSSKASSQHSSVTPKRRRSKKSLPSTVPKVKLDKKKNGESSKKVVKLEMEDSDVIFVSNVTTQNELTQESMSETLTNNQYGGVEEADPEIIIAAQKIENCGVLTSKVVDDIVADQLSFEEEKSVEPIREKKTIIREKRKPKVVAPAS